jgi:glycosyltransferase involved in cell wall biosynthesis
MLYMSRISELASECHADVVENLRVAYAAGPGDVIGSFHHWANGEADPNEVAETYSGQFYRKIRQFSLSAYVIASHPRNEILKRDWITIEHRPKSARQRWGLAYHVAEIRYWLGVIRAIARSGADIAVVGDMVHWWLLTLLHLKGIRVVPTLHCTFWPKGHRPRGFAQRAIQRLNGWFWRHIPLATICISPECERQVRELAGTRVCGTLLQARPLYARDYFAALEAPNWNQRPFRLLFAGRIESNKGVFELLDLAASLDEAVPGGFVIEVCGSGGEEQRFISEIERRKLSANIRFHGRLDRQSMRAAFERAHAVVVPTTADFAEGLNKALVEGVLAGRPVVASDVCPAAELFEYSAITVPAGDVEAMAQTILRLASDRDFYDGLRVHCRQEAQPFYELANSWARALRLALSCYPNRAGSS